MALGVKKCFQNLESLLCLDLPKFPATLMRHEASFLHFNQKLILVSDNHQ